MPRLSRKRTMRRRKPRNMSKRRLNKKVSRRRVNRKKRSNRKSRKKRNSLFGGVRPNVQAYNRLEASNLLMDALDSNMPPDDFAQNFQNIVAPFLASPTYIDIFNYRNPKHNNMTFSEKALKRVKENESTDGFESILGLLVDNCNEYSCEKIETLIEEIKQAIPADTPEDVGVNATLNELLEKLDGKISEFSPEPSYTGPPGKSRTTVV